MPPTSELNQDVFTAMELECPGRTASTDPDPIGDSASVSLSRSKTSDVSENFSDITSVASPIQSHQMVTRSKSVPSSQTQSMFLLLKMCLILNLRQSLLL